MTQLPNARKNFTLKTKTYLYVFISTYANYCLWTFGCRWPSTLLSTLKFFTGFENIEKTKWTGAQMPLICVTQRKRTKKNISGQKSLHCNGISLEWVSTQSRDVARVQCVRSWSLKLWYISLLTNLQNSLSATLNLRQLARPVL